MNQMSPQAPHGSGDSSRLRAWLEGGACMYQVSVWRPGARWCWPTPCSMCAVQLPCRIHRQRWRCAWGSRGPPAEPLGSCCEATTSLKPQGAIRLCSPLQAAKLRKRYLSTCHGSLEPRASRGLQSSSRSWRAGCAAVPPVPHSPAVSDAAPSWTCFWAMRLLARSKESLRLHAALKWLVSLLPSSKALRRPPIFGTELYCI